jgi:galactokinase
LTALIGIAYQQAYGRACGFAFKHTRQDFHGIGFFTLGNVPRGAGFTPV